METRHNRHECLLCFAFGELLPAHCRSDEQKSGNAAQGLKLYDSRPWKVSVSATPPSSPRRVILSRIRSSIEAYPPLMR